LPLFSSVLQDLISKYILCRRGKQLFENHWWWWSGEKRDKVSLIPNDHTGVEINIRSFRPRQYMVCGHSPLSMSQTKSPS